MQSCQSEVRTRRDIEYFRGQLRKSEKRWQRRWLQDALDRWRAGVEAQRRRRSLLQRGLKRHHARLLAKAFQIWRAATAHAHQLKVIQVKDVYCSHFAGGPL